MIWELFSIRDNALGAYLRPFCARARGEANRIFRNEINNNQGDMFRNADDYDLYHVGTFNDADAQFTTQTPELVVRGKDCKESG